MSEQLRYQILIAAAAGVIFFTNLGQTALWDMDESLYTTCAREMFERNDWVVPWFNGAMFPEKPPLMFWGMIAGFELFGVGEFGARFFSAILGVGTALIVFHIGRILFDSRVGLWAGLITASTIISTISARAATCDSSLTFLTAAAFLMFALAMKEKGAADGGRGIALRYAVPMYAFIGTAVLSKGPVGMVLPLAAIGLYLLLADGWRNVWRSAWRMRPLTAIVVIAVVATPWYVWVGLRTNWEWPRQFFLEFNLRPFKKPILGHGDTDSLQQVLAVLASLSYYFYHIPAVLAGFFPWSVFLGPAAIETVRQIRRRDARRDGLLLAACWFGTWFVFWSICKTKLPHYLLPAYPALGLLTACFISRWLDEQKNAVAFPRWWLRNAWISMIVVGLVMTIAVPIVTWIYLPGSAILGLLGLVPLAGGVWCWTCESKGQSRAAAVAFAVAAVVFLTAAFGFGAILVDRHQNARPMIAAIRADWEKHGSDDKSAGGEAVGPPIATFRFFRESTVYYAGYPVTLCDGDNSAAFRKMADFMARSNRAYIVTTDSHEAELAKQFPDRFEMVFRSPRFMARGDVIVFASKANERQ